MTKWTDRNIIFKIIEGCCGIQYLKSLKALNKCGGGVFQKHKRLNICYIYISFFNTATTPCPLVIWDIIKTIAL